MAVLSPNARALLSSSRLALRPTAADRDRVRSALRVRLGSSVAPPRAAASRWQLASNIIVALSLFGGALFFALRPGDGAVNAAPPRVTPIAVPEAALSESPAEAPAATPAVPSAVLAGPVAPTVHLAQDSLAREVALLSRAASELHRGNAAQALNALNAHGREFPNGLLSEERRAAKAQALCLLGRASEARSELARLAPRSPAAARAMQVCSAASAAPPAASTSDH